MLKFFGTSLIKTFVFDFFQSYCYLAGKVVIDIPAGDGHIFLLPIQKLRILVISSGFKIDKVHKVKVSSTSMFLGILYPLIVLVNMLVYIRNVIKNDGIPRSKKRKIYWGIIKLNIHPTILVGRHLFLELTKESELSDINNYVNERSV